MLVHLHSTVATQVRSASIFPRFGAEVS